MAVQYREGRRVAFPASTTLSQYRRVRLDANLELAYCSDTSLDGIGTLDVDALAAHELCAVNLTNAQGTQIMVAGGVIDASAGACKVYAAANGKIDDSGTVVVGYALSSATADGDHVEVLPRVIA